MMSIYVVDESIYLMGCMLLYLTFIKDNEYHFCVEIHPLWAIPRIVYGCDTVNLSWHFGVKRYNACVV